MAAALRRRLVAAATVGGLLVAVSQPRRASAESCDAFEVEYALSGNLLLTETPYGKGDGLYRVGPGRMVLRFENEGGVPGGKVKMLAYEMHEHFVVQSSAFIWHSDFTSNTDTSVTPNACAAAEGTLSGGTLRWETPLIGYRTAGRVACRGSLCGKGGAPPEGTMDLHLGPGPVRFSPLVLSPDASTFTMRSTLVSKTETPKLTAHMALAGREVRRSCAPARTCK
jgi:hypothetical protein